MGNLNRLLKYTGKYYQNIIVSLTAMLVQVWAGFKIPLLMKDIIDEAIPNKDYDDLLRTTILMVAVALFGLGAGLLNN